MCCGRRPDGPAAESSAKEWRASFTKEGKGVVTREIRGSCLLHEVAGDGLASLWRLSQRQELGGSSTKAEQALERWHYFARVVARSSLHWKRSRRCGRVERVMGVQSPACV